MTRHCIKGHGGCCLGITFSWRLAHDKSVLVAAVAFNYPWQMAGRDYQSLVNKQAMS